MKTFKKFLEESYLVLERSKPKFRGTRTHEEISSLQDKRRKQKGENPDPSPISQKIIDKYREKAIHYYTLSKTPEGKIDTNSPHYKKSSEYNSRALGRELPDYQVLDTKLFRGSTKGALRKLSQATRAVEKRKGLNPDTVKPSEHPDTHPSKASEFDKIVHRRRVRRNKAKRNKEAIDTTGREFRRGEIQKTIGKISGQLKR